MNLGDTFLSRYPEPTHLYVVIYRAPNRCISVNFTTALPTSDFSCVIQAGEHAFVTHETVVRYNAEIDWTSEKIIEDAPFLIGRRLDPVTPALLERIQRGALRSKFAKTGLKDLLRPLLANPAP